MKETEQIEKISQRHLSPAAWVPTLYFAMGMPLIVINMVCPVMYSKLGISDGEITFWISLLAWPWTLKFLWSPFLEMYKTKKFFVVATQLITGIMFGLVAFALHLSSFFAISIAMLAVIAMSGGTHDIAADGTYMSVLSKEKQKQWIGCQSAFYNIAKIVASGGLVYLAGSLIKHFTGDTTGLDEATAAAIKHQSTLTAWIIIMLVIGCIMIALGVYHYFFLPSTGKSTDGKKNVKEVLEELLGVFVKFFQKKHIIYYIFFVILYRLAEGFVMKIVPLFLIAPRASQGLGLTEQEYGLCYGTCGAAAFVIGSILAGYYITRRGLQKSLFSMAIVFNLPFVVYTFLAIYQPESLWLIGSGIAIEYFGYGFGFAGLTLFMMHQIAPGEHQMANYACASGFMNLSIILSGMLSGFVSDALGYRNFFIFVLFFTIPALLITWFVPFTYPDKK